MRILLVCPPHPSLGDSRHALSPELAVLEPLGLEYVAAGVRDFCDVKLLDMRLENGFEGLQETLEKFEPDIVGSSAMTVHVNDCKRISRMAKAFNRNILTVVGGHHAAVAPEDLLDESIDVLVIGWEGVFTFKEIVETLRRGGDLRGVRGIGLRDGDKLCRTPSRGGVKLGDLPSPDRSLGSHVRNGYRFLSPMGPPSVEPTALVRLTEGCNFKCDFCAGWVATGGKLYASEPELVVNELTTVKEDAVQWADGSVFAHRNKALQLATLIRKAGIEKKHYMGARSDEIVGCPELVERWREVGLEQVFLGLEAGLDRELDNMNKRTSIQQNREAIRICQANQVGVAGTFIVDTAYEKSDFERLAEHIAGLNVDYPMATIWTPLPGTQVFEAAKRQFIVQNWVFWDTVHVVVPTKLELEEFYNEYQSLLIKIVAEKWIAWAARFKEETGQDLWADVHGDAGLISSTYSHHALDEPNL